MSVLKLAPNFAQKSEVLYKLAVIFGKTYQIEHAINYFKLASPELPCTTSLSRRVDILIKLGICYMELKQHGEALKTFESALALDDKNSRVLQHVAWCEHMMNRPQQALEHAARAIILKDTESEGYYIQGRVHLATGRLAEAKEAINKAIARTQNRAAYYASLGQVNFMERSYSEAFDSYLKATQIDASMPEVWFNIGLLYELHQQSSEALIAYQRAITAAPDFTEALSRKQFLSADPYAPTPSAVPSPLPPSFSVPDSMVPIKSYANSQHLKKAADSALPIPRVSASNASTVTPSNAIVIVPLAPITF
jgi:tetratricopeptide (TPR) repeat protein